MHIETQQSSEPVETALFQQVLGDSFAQLPQVTRKLHRGWPAVIATGSATVLPASSILGRLVARMFGLPKSSGEVPLKVVIESRDGLEYWTRRFGQHRMRSVMRARAGLLEEIFGPVSIAMRLVATQQGLDMHPVSGRFAGIPLPRFLLPSVVARETSEAGRHVFEVDIGLPIIGRLVAYRGSLDV